jgi:plasmid replication initiation protein
MELLMQWQDTKRLYIKLEDYRHALEIPETYRYVDVRLHCIEKPIQELREKCQIDIQWTPIKDKENKRRVGSLEFTWKSVEQIEIPLEGGEKPKKKRGRKPKEA